MINTRRCTTGVAHEAVPRLGLDIARRIAKASGGTLTVGQSASGGGSVTVGLGPIVTPAEGISRHRRTDNGSE